MRTSLVLFLVSFAAIAFFGIIGVFGILPALAALSLFVAIAAYTNVQWESRPKPLLFLPRISPEEIP